MTRYFTPALFRFIRELKQHNERPWFKENQPRFEEVVREPALDFISDFGEPLLNVSPHFTADPRKVGGSLFRIQRDTRFAKDKTPYKEWVGIHFRHIATKEDVHAPGLYLHLEPRASFAALGLWRPSTVDANKIRQAIVDDPAAWKRAAYNKRFVDLYEASGESLKRPPRGFDPEHPMIDDLKKKEFIASTRLKQSDITSSDFMDIYLDRVKAGAPFIKFLTEAVGQNF
jgi:uncharacterized protein (TIGR02453 family)